MKAPEPQGYLTEEGRRIYFEVCKILDSVGGLEEVDTYGLSMLSDSLDQYQLACEQVKIHGPIQIYKTGAQAPSAWSTVKKEAWTAFYKLSEKYGLSTKDRQLIMKYKAKRKETDAIDEL